MRTSRAPGFFADFRFFRVTTGRTSANAARSTVLAALCCVVVLHTTPPTPIASSQDSDLSHDVRGPVCRCHPSTSRRSSRWCSRATQKKSARASAMQPRQTRADGQSTMAHGQFPFGVTVHRNLAGTSSRSGWTSPRWSLSTSAAGRDGAGRCCSSPAPFRPP